MVPPTAVISRAPSAVFRRLSAGDGAAVLNLETGQYHGVNGMGVVIWELLNSPITLVDLVEGVRSSVTDPPATLGDDVAAFVEALQQRGLIIVGDGDGPTAAAEP